MLYKFCASILSAVSRQRYRAYRVTHNGRVRYAIFKEGADA